jgi:hypothetical protein
MENTKTELERKNITKISIWDSSETTVKDINYDRVTMLEPTPKNMRRLMEKINELVDLVNELK